MSDPRGERRKHKPNTGLKCAICGEQAKWRQFIKSGWFRGDDEHVDTCDEHWKQKHIESHLAAFEGET
jgi:hypothetical protein